MKDLMVIHDDNGVFVDLSKDSEDFLRDDYSLDFVSLEDSLYIGLYKPFSSFYIELKTPTVLADLEFSINSNAIDLRDDTKDFQRSGFVELEKPANWQKETINGVEGYWLEVGSLADFIVEIQGVNLVFADDNDLAQEVRNIDNLMAKGDTSFIAYHVAARNEIIQTLRNGGLSKKVDELFANITKWDLLDLGEIRQAAKYLTLSKIFLDISENVEDKFYRRFRDYEGMYGKAFKVFYLSLDQDDDGLYDQEKDLVLNQAEIVIV